VPCRAAEDRDQVETFEDHGGSSVQAATRCVDYVTSPARRDGSWAVSLNDREAGGVATARA